MLKELPKDLFVSIHGVRTRYWAAGDSGPGVIFIHGLGGFIENWTNNIGAFSQYYRTYALDLLGFGQTDKTPLVHDMDDLVRFIHGFMETLHIEKASLIGNSMGGGLALQFALDYPEMVDKLVLADNAGMGREVCSDFRLCSLPLVNGFILSFGRNDPSRMLKMLAYDPSVFTPEFKEQMSRYSSGPASVKALLSTISAGINILGQKDKITRQLRQKLHTIKNPTLIVWGNNDRIIPVAHAQIAVKNIPAARLERFDNCGHMPMFEQPDKFNKLVLDFLKE
jgi:pimeloyl-ACP methyl ester carboxylesterase